MPPGIRFLDEPAAPDGVRFLDEPAPAGVRFLDEPAEEPTLLGRLADAYAEQEAILAPAVIRAAKARADEKRLLAGDRGKLGGIELTKGGAADREVDLASRVIGAGVEAITGVPGITPSVPALATSQLAVRTGTDPTHLAAEVEAAREADQARQDARDAQARADLLKRQVGVVEQATRAATGAGEMLPVGSMQDATAGAQRAERAIGEWAAEVNPVRGAIHALGAGGRAIARATTGGRGYAQASRDAMDKLRHDPGSMTPDDAMLAGLPIIGRYLYGQDGEDAGVVGNDLLLSVALDPINAIGGPGFTAGGRIARGIKRIKLGQAVKLGIDMTEDLARYEAKAAKLATSPDLAVTLADQVIAKHRTAATIAGVPIERLVPGARYASAKLHEGLGWMGETAKAVIGPERAARLAYDYRFTSLLSPAEQDRLLMDYLKSKQTKYMAQQIKLRFEADGEGLKAARARFDRATGNAEADQTRAMLGIFEEGPANELRARVLDGIGTRTISRDEGAFLLRAQRRARDMLKLEEVAGVQGVVAGVKGLIKGLDEQEITYLHHAQTQEWRDAAAKVYKDKTPSQINDLLIPSLKSLMEPGHGKERAWDMSVRAANEKARDLLAGEAARRGVAIDLSQVKLFHENINLIMAARHIKSIKAIHAADRIAGYAQAFSVEAATLGKDFGTMSALQLRELAKVRVEFAQAYRDVWAAVAKDPVRFAEGVADEALARKMLAKTKRQSDIALGKAKTAEDFAAIRADLEGIAGGPGMAPGVMPEFEARAGHAAAVGKAEAAAGAGIDAAARAEATYAAVAPMAGEARGATRALRDARRGFKEGVSAPDVLPGSLDRLRGATDDLATLHELKSDWVVFGLDAPKGLAGRALPPDVAAIVTNYQRQVATKPGYLAAAWDFHQQWWKAWSLGPRPAFHTRNWFSGKFNTWLEDALHPVSEYLSKLFLSPVDSSRATFSLGGKRVLLHTEHDAFEQLGGRGARYTESIQEMADGLEAKLAGDDRWQALAAGKVGKTPLERVGRTIQAYVPLSTKTTAKSLALRAGAYTGDLAEHDLRFSHYLGRRLKGDSQIDAMMSAKRAHFDYGEFTQKERETYGRAITFANYLRAQSEFQLSTMFAKPGKIARKEHVIEALAGKDPTSDEYGGIPEDLFPEHLRKAGLGRVGKVVNGRVHVWTRSSFDTSWDLTRFGDVDDGIMGSLATPLQLALGLATGRDSYSGRALRGLEGQAPGGYGASRELFGNRVHPVTAFTAEKLLPASLLEAHRLGVFGGKAAQPLYGIKGEPVSWRIPLPFHEKADEPDRAQPPVGERVMRYLIGMRPYEVELWKEGQRRANADLVAYRETVTKLKHETSEQDRKRLLLQAVEFKARRADTVSRYEKAGIRLEAPELPIEGYE